MSNNTTQHIPADVRELVAREVFALDEDWRREYWLQFRREYPVQAGVYYDTADRILAIVRTPRGEEEAWPGDAENDASFLRSWARYLRTEAQDIREAQDLPDWKQQAEYTEVAAARMDQIANRIAALRSEAQGDGPVR